MKVLVTGGSGFIGSHIVEAYLEAGFEVAVLDHLITDNSLAFPTKVKVYQYDITDPAVEEVFQSFRPDIVNHHAALIKVQESLKFPSSYALVNELGTLKLLQLSKKFQVKHFIFASSAAVYGECQNLPITEAEPCQPTSFYGANKLIAESYIKLYQKDFLITIFRYGNVYGPRQLSTSEGGVIAIFADRLCNNHHAYIYGDGKQTRDFIFVKDIARLNIQATQDHVTGLMNLAAQSEISITNLFNKMVKAAHQDNKPYYKQVRKGDIKKSILANQKATSKLGKIIKYPFEIGLAETISYYWDQKISDMKKLCIIMPAFNEAPVIGEVLDDLHEFVKTFTTIQTDIVVINDGSGDNTGAIAKEKGVKVLTHVVNRGLGGALATGLTYAKRQSYDIAITLDSDGQHSFKDIPNALKPILNKKADVVIGSRMLGQTGMPWDRRWINRISSLITWLMFGIWSTDSQSGFRVFNKKALQTINIRTQGMEVSSEFFAEINRNHLSCTEIPITVIYTDYSRHKGQNNLNSFSILYKLLLRLFR